ncbi:MAG: SAM-dependent methyltransferase [Bacteroidales bacterium]|nr:SAM-dependent methyltransferase [Bacteroidales bacterium]
MANNLYLLPSDLGESDSSRVFPNFNLSIVQTIKIYVVENERTARRQLIKMGIKTPIDDLTFHVLNKHTQPEEITVFLAESENEDIGLLSEAGVPGVADPGSEIVALAHKKGIRVVPLIGPSSILLSLMASGFNGQSFSFTGYLPVKPHLRQKRLKELEKMIQKFDQTQIFIETPYRNNNLLEDIIKHCSPTTRLCIAAEITTDKEFIKTQSLAYWKKNKPDLHKKPTVFILGR